MVILDNNKKEMLINKLLFTLNFMVTTNRNFEETFDVRVIDAEEGTIKMFELMFKENKEVYIYFKRLFNGDVEMRFVVTTPEQYVRDESTLRFIVGTNDDITYCEFLDIADKIFDIVTEIEKENQYNKLNDTINSLLKY